jgi:DNA repair exonuclease SbcCD ATPase subunit
MLLAAVSLPAAAQTSAKDVSQKATEAGEAIRDYTVEKKDEAVAHAKKLVADLDAKIKELETQASRQTGEARARLQAQIRDLRAKRAAAAKKLDELTRASKASWEHAKQGFADAYRDLAQAFEKATAEFRK